MLCVFEFQKWPYNNGDSENGNYIVEYRCTESSANDPLAVDATGGDLLGQHFVAKGYKIPRDKLAQYDLKGHWETKNGRRTLIVEEYDEIRGTDEKSVIDFLSSRLPRIGKAKAQALWDTFGKDVWDVLDNHPERLAEIKGISKNSIPDIINSYNEKKSIKDIQMLFNSLGLPRKLAEQVYNEYGVNTEKKVKEQPFSLVGRYRGFTFDAADRIAIANKLDPKSKERVKAAALEVLHQAEQGGETCRITSGHLCVEVRDLIMRIEFLLGKTYALSRDFISEMILELCEPYYYKGKERPSPLVKVVDVYVPPHDVYIYSRKMYDMESQLAFNIAKLARRKFRNTFSIADEIRLKELEENLALAPEQKSAVETGLSHAFAVITGGPGTGKTTILKFIRDIYKKRNKDCKILLCSPTGVAATRMTASTGAEASTVHKAMNLRPDDEGDGIYGDITELDYDFIVVDETSMLDIFLTSALLRSIKNGARLLFLGDIDQLPSVGPGAVLRDIIKSGVVAVARLTKVYRQAAENKIAINAILIKNGKSSFDYKKGEFEFIPANNFAQARDIMENLYLQEIAANGIDNVMMLTPYRKKTESGVDSLNFIRDTVNPYDQNKAEMKVGEKTFRVGDKVINLRNNNIASNGETGMIIQIGMKVFTNKDKEEKKKCITVDFGHSKRDYDMDDALEMLDWAYAMTVHKSQGSEAKVVILNLMNGHYNMLKRNLLYTAITRAKVRVYIVGQMSAIERAVKSGISKEERRNTLLAQKINWIAKLSDKRFSELNKIMGN